MRYYGRHHSMGKKGSPEDPTKCIAAVQCPLSKRFYQCTRKRGHGPNRAYCKQHGKMREADFMSVYVPKDATCQKCGAKIEDDVDKAIEKATGEKA